MTYLKELDEIDLIRIESGSTPPDQAIPAMAETIRLLWRELYDLTVMEESNEEKLNEASSAIDLVVKRLASCSMESDKIIDQLVNTAINPPEPDEGETLQDVLIVEFDAILQGVYDTIDHADSTLGELGDEL